MNIPKPEQYLLDDLLPFEKVHPIFSIDVRWSQDIDEDSAKTLGPGWTEGLPEGRMHGRTQWYVMYLEELDVEAKIKELQEEWWPGFVEKQKEGGDKNLSEPTITIEFKMWETWKLEWFCHHTFDVGQTDDQVLASFRRFVDRAMCQNDRELDSRPLMGAEDSWRWSAQPEDQNPPCRCEHCKKQGIIRIAH